MVTRTVRSYSGIPLLVTLLVAGCGSPPDIGQRVSGYVDTQGRVVISPVYRDARPFHEGRAAVKGPRGWGFIDAQGHWVAEGQYEEAESFADGRARVRGASGAWGYIDRAGAPVIPPQFTCESPFFGGRAFVQPAKGPVQLIDAGGRIVRELVGVELVDLEWGPCKLLAEDEKSLGFNEFSAWVSILAAGDEDALEALQEEQLFPAQVMSTQATGSQKKLGNTESSIGWTAGPSDAARFVRVGATAPRDQLIGYLDPHGNWAIAPVLTGEAGPFVGGRARVKRDEKVGFIDRAGRIVVPLQFDDALYRFSRDRTVALRDGHAWLIDGAGKPLADLGAWPWPGLDKDVEKFNTLAVFVGLRDFFAEGLIPWQRAGKWGYVGMDGKWVIDPQYDSAQPFRGGGANVQKGERWILIDVTGRHTAEPAIGWIGPRDGSLTRGGTSTRWGFANADGSLPQGMPFATSQVQFGAMSFVDTRPLQFAEGLAAVSQISRPVWKVIDEQGRTLATGQFERLMGYLGRNRFAYLDDERWGLTDSHLRVLVPARFDVRIRGFSFDELSYPERTVRPKPFGRDGYVFARSQGRGGCVDSNGLWAFTAQHLITATCEGPVMPARADTAWGAIGIDGRWRIPPKYDSVNRLEDRPEVFLVVTKDQQSQLVRATEHRLYYSAWGVATPCVSSRLCLLKVGKQWQRLDPESLQPTGPTLDEVKPIYFEQDGIQLGRGGAQVRKGTHWGYLAKSGDLTVPFSYDEMFANQEGTEAAVRQGQRWGVASLTGPLLVPIRYDELKPAGPGYYAMRVAKHWGIVDSRGREIFSPHFDEIVVPPADGLVLAKRKGRDFLVTMTGKAVLDAPPELMQHIHNLSDHSAKAWSAFTRDHLYFINKRTLTTHELLAPHGFVLHPFSSDSRVKEVSLAHAPGEVAVRRILADDDGELVPGVFDEASWSAVTKRFTVWRGGRCGVLDSGGHWVVPMPHDYCADTGNPEWIIVGDAAH